jgi:hypothetical protein
MSLVPEVNEMQKLVLPVGNLFFSEIPEVIPSRRDREKEKRAWKRALREEIRQYKLVSLPQ